MYIYHNLPALKTVNCLSQNSKNQERSMKQLASGEKFSSAGDGAASIYAISEKMRVQLRALNAANKNVSDGRNFSNTAMGGLENILDILKGVKEKCLASANGIYSAQDRKIMNADVQHALEEMTEIAVTTEQNGIHPLNAQTGAYNGKMVIDNRYPYSDRGEFRPVADIDGTQIRISDEGSGLDYYNQIWLCVNGVRVGTSGTDNITSMPGWTAIRQESDKVWSRQLDYVDVAHGINIRLTQKTTLQSNYSDSGMKYGESYATSFELENLSGGPAIVDFVYMIDTDLYKAGGDAPRCETYHDEAGGIITEEMLYLKNSTGLPEYFESLNDIGTEAGICAGVTVAQGENAPDALILTQFLARELDEIKDGVNTGSLNGAYAVVDEDLSYYMAWVDKMVSDKITFDTGSYGFHTLDKNSPTAWIQSGTKSNDGFNITLCSATAESMGLGNVNVLTEENALAAIDTIDKAYERLAKMSTAFGTAYQRCENAGNLNTIYHENLSSAESVIRDANMAKEFVNFTKSNILSQASQAMLAQAGQNVQTVLSLLNT